MKKIVLLIIEKIRKALKVDEKGNSFGWRKGTLLLVTLIMVGCLSKRDSNGVPYDVHVIDSCEYIDGGHAYGLGHKGNCRFCKERRKKELKELVEQLKEK